jgi:hypothetical protein
LAEEKEVEKEKARSASARASEFDAAARAAAAETQRDQTRASELDAAARAAAAENQRDRAKVLVDKFHDALTETERLRVRGEHATARLSQEVSSLGAQAAAAEGIVLEQAR